MYRSIPPPIFCELFRQRDISYNLQSNPNFAATNVKSVIHGSESISYLGSKIWDIVLLKLKELTSLTAFKKGIKNGNQKIVSVDYLSNTYQNLGFITNI